MNLKSVYKYQLNDIKKSILIFYLVIACVLALIALWVALSPDTFRTDASLISGPEYNIKGMETASIIFLFVCGLNMFREAFRMSMQNGVSRKSIWSGTAFTFLTVGGGMALIDTIIRMVLLSIGTSHKNIEMAGLYDLIYAERSMRNGPFQNAFEGLLLNFCLYIAALAVGYFITLGYYRMNKIAKIAVSIGVPAFLFIILPIIIELFIHNDSGYVYYHMTRFALGGNNYDNPYFAMGSGLLFSAVFLGFTYLMIRRAPVKD